MNDKIDFYKVKDIISILNISKDFFLTKIDGSSSYSGSFCLVEYYECRNTGDRILLHKPELYLSYSEIKFMVSAGFIYKECKHKYRFRYLETLRYFNKRKVEEENRIKRYNEHISRGYVYGWTKQGDKTRPIVTDYRRRVYKHKKRMEFLESIDNHKNEETITPKFVPPKNKTKSKPWAYHRCRVQREIEKDYF